MESNIRPYEDVLILSAGEVLEMFVGTSLDVTYRTIWKRPQDVTLGSSQNVIFQRPEDVGREHFLALH